MNTARALEELKRVPEAAMQYEKALKRYPSTANVISGTAAFYWRQNRYESAAELIARGRKIEHPYSRWYFEEFITVFENQSDEAVINAIVPLQKFGATNWELRALSFKLAKSGRHEAAYKTMSSLTGHKPIERILHKVKIYKLLSEWKGKKDADQYLKDNISPNERAPMMMILYEQGLFNAIIEQIGNPDDYEPKNREFMWLQYLIAWMAGSNRPEELEPRFLSHFEKNSSDSYHAIGRFLLGKLSESELLARIRTKKQKCEFAYYIGLSYRLKGDFRLATHWYHICLETLLYRNGEFHWAENELYWWACLGISNRNRLMTDDINAFKERKIEDAKVDYI
jgi:hypothetical protein